MGYEVKLDLFEGPLDLLLYLVQKEEVDPRDITISQITDQFLRYIDEMERLDLSVGGDFLFMASRLMALKARELLPRDEQDEMDLLEFDEDREALIRQMIEYQKFKEAARNLRHHEYSNFGAFSRGKLERPRKRESDAPLDIDAGIFQLFQAFQKALRSRVRGSVHTIELDDVTIEDRQQLIENYLRDHGRAMFEDLLGRDQRRLVAAVTFMAVLEMVKQDSVVLRQSETAGAIWIYRKRANADYAEEMARDKMLYSEDPNFQAGLSSMLRARTDAREGLWDNSLDNILKEVTQRVSRGEVVSEQDLRAMLDTDAELADLGELSASAWLEADHNQNLHGVQKEFTGTVRPGIAYSRWLRRPVRQNVSAHNPGQRVSWAQRNLERKRMHKLSTRIRIRFE